MNPVGKPDAGNRHVRFDERGEETERCRMAQVTAPLLDSTRSSGLQDHSTFVAPGICRNARVSAQLNATVITNPIVALMIAGRS